MNASHTEAVTGPPIPLTVRAESVQLTLQKSPTVYVLILASWAAVLGLAAPAMIEAAAFAARAGLLIGILAVASSVFIAYFWLNGMKDLVYTGYYHLRMKAERSPVPVRSRDLEPRVVMVYCTYNDFSAESLARSSRQDYGNAVVVILDDSTDPTYRDAVDRYATQHAIRVVRRTGRTGFKAGNLNNFLGSAQYDYFVILDSDEIAPPYFISRALDYFEHYGNVGIVQANHIATRNRNAFMDLFSAGVDSHWTAYQSVKDRHGFLSLLGHGAMVSRECYAAVGGFPMVVAEDLALSIAARAGGFVTAFAPDIVCEEEYPVDYLAFKKRHSKWAQGNMEFIKRFSGTILRSRMTWFEKLDIVLFSYSLPLTAFFSLYVVLHVIALPLLGHVVRYPQWMLIPTAAFFVAPMLNDILFHRQRMTGRRLTRYLLHTVLLYGSMFYVSVRTSIQSAFGTSVFLVTPKEATRVSFGEALRANIGETTLGVGLGLIATALTGSLLPVLLLAVPAISSLYLTVMHQTSDPAAIAA
jgi:cellulose synthase/poly-beta-1,6-N-acetylglucosamine synthase-like glycosyltransferase